MAAPLRTCTKIEQHGVVHFLWAKNMEAKDIHKEMLPMYGEHCLSHQESIIGCRSSRKDGQVSKTNIESIGLRSDSNRKNFSPQVSRDL